MTTFRRATALMLEFVDADSRSQEGTACRLRITNVLERRSCLVSAPAVSMLCDIWPGTSRDGCLAQIALLSGDPDHLELLEQSAVLVAEGSEADRRDQSWSRTWKFGAAAAALQFGYRSGTMPDWSARADRLRRVADEGQTELERPVTGSVVLPAGKPSGLGSLLGRRRTCRSFADVPIDPEALGSLAFALAGHTGELSDPVLGPHPLRTSPSTGARSPFEVFLFAQRVRDLEAGTYWYDGHGSLEPVSERVPELRKLTGDQPWFAESAVVFILVGWPERLAAKYPQPRAYAAMLVEAGHRAQNALLTATDLGLAGCVTLEADPELVAEATGLDPITYPPIYVIAVGVPA